MGEEADYFYIKYFNREYQYILERLKCYDIAVFYLEKELDLEYITLDVRFCDPILVTNDPRLYYKYRNVFSAREFEAYCVDGNKSRAEIDKLPWDLQAIARRSAVSEGERIFDFFTKIVNKEISTAKTYTKNETWIEENSGYSYSGEIDSGWETSDNMTESVMLEKDYQQSKSYLENRSRLVNELLKDDPPAAPEVIDELVLQKTPAEDKAIIKQALKDLDSLKEIGIDEKEIEKLKRSLLEDGRNTGQYST